MQLSNPEIIHKNSIKALYKKQSLDEITNTAIGTTGFEEGAKAFSKFQQQRIHNLLPGFAYEYWSTMVATLSSMGQQTEIKTIDQNLSHETIPNYIEKFRDNEMTHLVYANPGRAFGNYTPIRGKALYPHSKSMDIRLGYTLPGHDRTFIIFNFLGEVISAQCENLDLIELEIALFPFGLAWLYQSDKIDLSKFARYMSCIEGLTKSRFLNLRKYINAPHQTLSQQAEDLGIKPGTLKDSLREIRDNLSTKPQNNKPSPSNTPLRGLEEHFSFLRMLGDHTAAYHAPPKV